MELINRAELENKIKNFASTAGIIFLEPSVQTKIGNVEMIGEGGSCMEEIEGDWVVNGTITKLDNEDFNKIYHAVMETANRILSMAY